MHVGARRTASPRGRSRSCGTASIFLNCERHLRRASQGRRGQRLQQRRQLATLDSGERLEYPSRLGALATMPHRDFVEGARASVVQVRARVAELPQRRPIRRTRRRRPGRRRRRAGPQRGWRSRMRQSAGDPSEQPNPAPWGGGMKTGREARGRTRSSEGPRIRQADHLRYH
jgi:hypothetical protein